MKGSINEFKIFFLIYVLFQILSFFIWGNFLILILILISFWFFIEKKVKKKIEIFIMMFSLIIFFGHFIFFVKTPKYENPIEGNYYVSDTIYLNRSQNVIYPENKYILKEVSGNEKIVIKCSMLLNQCNVNKIGDLVLVKYVNSCSRMSCNKFIYEIDGGGVKLNSNFFKNKYFYERKYIKKFLFLYIFPFLSFLIFYLVVYYRVTKNAQ